MQNTVMIVANKRLTGNVNGRCGFVGIVGKLSHVVSIAPMLANKRLTGNVKMKSRTKDKAAQLHLFKVELQGKGKRDEIQPPLPMTNNPAKTIIYKGKR